MYPFDVFADFVKKGYVTTTEPDESGRFNYTKNDKIEIKCGYVEDFIKDFNIHFVAYTKGSSCWEAIYTDNTNYYLVNYGDRMGDGFDYIYLVSKDRAISELSNKDKSKVKNI